jgi:hypothetical protein
VLVLQALLHARLGEHAAARAALDGAAALLQGGDTLPFGELAAARSEAERRAGDASAAARALAEGESVRADLGLGPDSVLGRRLREMRLALEALAGSPSPALLEDNVDEAKAEHAATLLEEAAVEARLVDLAP